jgi:hypothetical protein
MKVTLDLSQLLETGKITQAEHDKLLALSAAGTGSLAFNILIGFGVVAVAGGGLALFPDPMVAANLGLASAIAGVLIGRRYRKQWGVLGVIMVLLGALFFGGGVMALTEGSLTGIVITGASFLVGGIIAKSGLLMTLATLAFSSCLGVATGYEHAGYFMGVRRPIITIVVFTLVAIGAYELSKRLRSEDQRLALIVSRTAVLLVNFGFWIGSLWGDDLGNSPDGSWHARAIVVPDYVFSAGWALALIGAVSWAVTANRRWLVNVGAVFGAIHLYTQWFERLGASPVTVLAAGLIAIGIAMGIWKYNSRAAELKA